MASGGNDVEDVLKTYLDRKATDDMLTLTQTVKCFDAAKLSKYKNALESSTWAKHQKPNKKCSVKTVATTIIEDTAGFFIAKKKGMKDKAPKDDTEVAACIAEIKGAIAKLKQTEKKEQKVDAVTKRLTDTSGYTGSHKERFDSSGKGKGIEGRAEIASNTGYVGAYKGEGTFDKK